MARILIVLAATTSAFAQPRCEVGVQAPPVGFWTWAAGTPIVVPKP